ncbi:M48 family metallopeptidase [Salinibacterium sp. GXW1014]|uniref:M48 family metallopeptidase n=1 Tax=Salinibacterium sp. GXW1014 TaxID=3377838 RepID=UPI00383AFEBD
MYRAIARNKRNTVFIILLFLILIAVLAFVADAIWGGGNWAIFTGTIVGALIYVVIQYFASGRQAVALSGARPIEKRDDPRLYRIVENLSITEGLPMPKVYIVDDPAPNAFAAGRDPQHAVVAATTGLLEMMTDAELEGVMAHEMGHVKNYDIRVTTIVFGLVVAIGFIADILMRMSFFGGNRNNNGGNPIVLVLGIAAMILAPLAATMVQAAVSREREYLADATGAMTTRHPEALASALAKLGQYGRPMRRQNTSMAHMWLSDPTKPGIVDRMFSTHPPLEKRIARLRTIGSGF